MIHAELCSGMNRWMLGRRAALLPNRPMAAPAKSAASSVNAVSSVLLTALSGLAVVLFA